MKKWILILIVATIVFNDGHKEEFDACYDSGQNGGGYSVNCKKNNEKMYYLFPKYKIERMIY